MLHRRGFLFGLLAAPAIIRTPGLLMPIKKPFVDKWPIVNVSVTLIPRPDYNVLARNGLFIVQGGINTFRVTTIGAGGGAGGRGL